MQTQAIPSISAADPHPRRDRAVAGTVIRSCRKTRRTRSASRCAPSCWGSPERAMRRSELMPHAQHDAHARGGMRRGLSR